MLEIIIKDMVEVLNGPINYFLVSKMIWVIFIKILPAGQFHMRRNDILSCRIMLKQLP